MGKFIDLTGCCFDRLTVVERSNNARDKQVQWVCKCNCGNTTIVRGNDLKKGRVKSCGCLKKETSRANGKTCITHGGKGTRLYRIWQGMRARCYKPNNPNYPRYGAKGVTVCEEWQNGFGAFRDWALANGYDETAPRGKYTIERKDPYGQYSPDNCRWATIQEQALNKRDSVFITYNGETLAVAAWARKVGIGTQIIHGRLRIGWSVERALTEPPRSKKRHQKTP